MFPTERFPFRVHGYLPSTNWSRAGASVSAAPRGQELRSLLASGELRNRFYSWRGASGRRYVCSVFQSGEESFLSDVSEGLIVGVALDGALRRPICVLSADEFKARGRLSLRETAYPGGVSEWHVHFCEDSDALRDLAASLLN